MSLLKTVEELRVVLPHLQHHELILSSVFLNKSKSYLITFAFEPETHSWVCVQVKTKSFTVEQTEEEFN